jgi:2,4-dienoyl-CoA reductase-like NADH-dependent reductase (Old Yellow Enzyme family)
MRGQKARALSHDELVQLREDFINAAERVKKAGFDGIELHGAHGYLLNQFSSPQVNKREDGYGGDISGRLRLAGEIITGIRQRLGSDFIICCRMGGNEPSLEDGVRIAMELERLGVDMLHVSASGFSENKPAVPEGFPYNWIVYCGVEIKRHVSVPVIAVNEIKTPERAAFLIENNLADFAAIGKDLLADPEWANKARESRSISSCLSCRPCKWFTIPEKCPKHKDQ